MTGIMGRVRRACATGPGRLQACRRQLQGSWAWKAVVAGSCGTLAHSSLMYLKARTGLLPAFQPYESLQAALGNWIGASVGPAVPWALSFLNGATLMGFLFARVSRFLPGRHGAAKGLVFGLIGWLVMGTVFFPLVGLGPFATGAGPGVMPGLFSLAMLLAYGVVMGSVYAWLNRISRAGPDAVPDGRRN